MVGKPNHGGSRIELSVFGQLPVERGGGVEDVGVASDPTDAGELVVAVDVFDGERSAEDSEF